MRHPFVRLTGERSTRSQLPTQIPRTKKLNIRIPSSALPNNPFIHISHNISFFIIRIKDCDSNALFLIP